jgi:TIR domain
MTASTSASASRIFVNYRREDTAYPAGWLFDRLVDHFGDGQIFKDVDSIELGDDFVQRITSAVGSSAVVLAVIGKRWLTVTGEQGQRRLDDPEDFVRLEIEAAFARGVRVIPVLVDGAQMPDKADLPATLAQLARRQALELAPNRFGADTNRLLDVLDKTLGEAGVAPTEPLTGTGRPSARGTGHPTLPPPPPPVQPPLNGGPRSLPTRRNIAGYGRFWIGLLFVASGLACFAAHVPHTVGYGPAVNIPNADTYAGAALAALIVIGALLLASAGISASKSADAPRDRR